MHMFDNLFDADTILLRRYAINQMKKAYSSGAIAEGFFGGDADAWFKMMMRTGEFCDDLFITYLAYLLGHDIIIIPLDDTPNEFHWKYGKFFITLNIFSCYSDSEIANVRPSNHYQ